MDMRRHVLSLIGASVAAGVFPTFHQAFATDAAERIGSDQDPADDARNSSGRHQQAAGARLPQSITHDIAWRPLAT